MGLVTKVPRNYVPDCYFPTTDFGFVKLMAEILRRVVWVLERNLARFDCHWPRRLEQEQELCAFIAVQWIKARNITSEVPLTTDT